MAASDDLIDELTFHASKASIAYPYVRVKGELLDRVIAELTTLRAELAGRQARVQAALFEGPAA